MSTRTNGPGAGWSWLMRGINTGRHQPKTVFGAAILLLLVALVPSAVQLFVQYVIKPGASGMLVMLGLMMLIGAVLYPLLVGGYLRILDATENGRTARASMLFEPFRAGRGGGRMIVFGLLIMAIYIVFLALVATTVGKGLASWYMQLLTMGSLGASAPTMPALPSDFGATLGLLVVFFILYSGVYAIGIGQVALRGQTPLTALSDGITGTLKNLLPLLVLAICGLVAGIIFTIVFGLLAGLIMVVAGLASKMLGFVLLAPLYIGLMLVMYVVMFGVMYALWQDVADDGQDSHATASATALEA